MIFLLLFCPRISLIVLQACFGVIFGSRNFVPQFFFASRKAVMAAFLEDLYLYSNHLHHSFYTLYSVRHLSVRPYIHISSNPVLHHTITLWFQCLDGLIQTRGKVARVKKSARNSSRRRIIFRAFLHSSNFSKCLDQAIQTRKP